MENGELSAILPPLSLFMCLLFFLLSSSYLICCQAGLECSYCHKIDKCNCNLFSYHHLSISATSIIHDRNTSLPIRIGSNRFLLFVMFFSFFFLKKKKQKNKESSCFNDFGTRPSVLKWLAYQRQMNCESRRAHTVYGLGEVTSDWRGYKS